MPGSEVEITLLQAKKESIGLQLSELLHKMKKDIAYYQKRHRLSLKQISELRAFKHSEIDKKIPLAQKQRALFVVAELLNVLDILKKSTIDHIHLKGPVLSWSLHQDFFTRISSDIDILIDIKNIESAISILIKEGYRPAQVDFPQSKNKKILILKTNNQFVLFNPGKRIKLELHWRILKHTNISKFELNQIIKENTRKINIQGRSLRIFKKEFDFLFLTLHGASHAWTRIKWLHDIYTYAKDKEINKELLIVLFRTFKAEHLLYQSLDLANRFWEIPPEAIKRLGYPTKKLRKNLIKFPLKSISSDLNHCSKYEWLKLKLGDIKYNLQLFPSLKYKLNYLRRFMFREVDMRDLILPDSLAFLYFVLRPFTYAYKKFRGYSIMHSIKDNAKKMTAK